MSDFNKKMKEHKKDKIIDKEKNIFLLMPIAVIGIIILFVYNFIINNNEPEYKEYKSTIDNIGKPPVKSFKYTIEKFNDDKQLACKTYDKFGYPVIVGGEKNQVEVQLGVSIWWDNVYKAYLVQKSKGWEMEVKDDDVIFTNDDLDLEITAFKYTDYKYVDNQYTTKCSEYIDNVRHYDKNGKSGRLDKLNTAPMFSIINK